MVAAMDRTRSILRDLILNPDDTGGSNQKQNDQQVLERSANTVVSDPAEDSDNFAAADNNDVAESMRRTKRRQSSHSPRSLLNIRRQQLNTVRVSPNKTELDKSVSSVLAKYNLQPFAALIKFKKSESENSSRQIHDITEVGVSSLPQLIKNSDQEQAEERVALNLSNADEDLNNNNFGNLTGNPQFSTEQVSGAGSQDQPIDMSSSLRNEAENRSEPEVNRGKSVSRQHRPRSLRPRRRPSATHSFHNSAEAGTISKTEQERIKQRWRLLLRGKVQTPQKESSNATQVADSSSTERNSESSNAGIKEHEIHEEDVTEVAASTLVDNFSSANTSSKSVNESGQIAVKRSFSSLATPNTEKYKNVNTVKSVQHPVFRRISQNNSSVFKRTRKPYQSSETFRRAEYVEYDELYDPAPPGPRYTTKPNAVLQTNQSEANEFRISSRYNSLSKFNATTARSLSFPKVIPVAVNSNKEFSEGSDEKTISTISKPDVIKSKTRGIAKQKLSPSALTNEQPSVSIGETVVIGQPILVPRPKLVDSSRPGSLPVHLPVLINVGMERGLEFRQPPVPDPFHSNIVPKPVPVFPTHLPPIYRPMKLTPVKYSTEFNKDRDSHVGEISDEFVPNSFSPGDNIEVFNAVDDHVLISRENLSTIPLPLINDPVHDSLLNDNTVDDLISSELAEASNEIPDFIPHKYIDYDEAAEPVQYGYRVASADTGNFQQRKEQRDGNTVSGSYQVALPDGRVQTVSYIADDDGFRAEVRYEDINTGAISSTPFPPLASSAYSSIPTTPLPPLISSTFSPGISSTAQTSRRRPTLSIKDKNTNIMSRQREQDIIGLPFPILPLPSHSSSHQNEISRDFSQDVVTGDSFISEPHLNRNLHDNLPLPHLDRKPQKKKLPSVVDVPPRQQFPNRPSESPHNKPDSHRTIKMQSRKVNSSRRQPPEPAPLLPNQFSPNFASEWLGEFGDHDFFDFKHEPVKPAPVKISINKPNGIPTYPGINLPDSATRDSRNNKISNTNEQETYNQRVSKRPITSSAVQNVVSDHSLASAEIPNNASKKGQLRFLEHTPLSTLSPNPFRLTISGAEVQHPRPRTTSRGRVVNSPGKYNILTEPSLPFANDDSKQPSTQTTFDHLSRAKLPGESNIDDRSKKFPSRSNTKKIQENNNSLEPPVTTLRSTFVFPSPATDLWKESRTADQRKKKEDRKHQQSLMPKSGLPPLPATHPHKISSSHFSNSNTEDTFQLFHYTAEAESSQESAEQATLYSANSTILLRALGQSSPVPLLLPYRDLDRSSLNKRSARRRAARFIPFEARFNHSDSSSPILSPIPVISFVDR